MSKTKEIDLKNLDNDTLYKLLYQSLDLIKTQETELDRLRILEKKVELFLAYLDKDKTKAIPKYSIKETLNKILKL